MKQIKYAIKVQVEAVFYYLLADAELAYVTNLQK